MLSEKDKEALRLIAKEVACVEKQEKYISEATRGVNDLFEIQAAYENLPTLRTHIFNFAKTQLSQCSKELSWLLDFMDDEPLAIYNKTEVRGKPDKNGCYMDLIEDGYFEGEQIGWIYIPTVEEHNLPVFLRFHVHVV